MCVYICLCILSRISLTVNNSILYLSPARFRAQTKLALLLAAHLAFASSLFSGAKSKIILELQQQHFVASNAGPRGHCCSCIYSLIISWSGLKSEPKWPRERRVLSFLMRMARELLEAQLKLKYETNCSQMASHNVINTKNLTAYGSELHCRGCSSQAGTCQAERPNFTHTMQTAHKNRAPNTYGNPAASCLLLMCCPLSFPYFPSLYC